MKHKYLSPISEEFVSESSTVIATSNVGSMDEYGTSTWNYSSLTLDGIPGPGIFLP